MKNIQLMRFNKNKLFVYIITFFILWITYMAYLYYIHYTNKNNKKLIIIETLDNLNQENIVNNKIINDVKDVNVKNNKNDKEPEPTDSKPINNVNADHSNINDFNKETSNYVKKWPCSMNVTGTFTECGPYAYNSCL